MLLYSNGSICGGGGGSGPIVAVVVDAAAAVFTVATASLLPLWFRVQTP